MATGLDRWKALQSSPFGRNTATNPDAYGGTTGSQLRRLNEDYNMATRLLRRQARRGDANSALNLIKLREEATAQGVQTGGIRQHEEYNRGILDRVRTMEQGAVDREKAAELNRQRMEEQQADANDAAAAKAPEDPATAQPGAADVPTEQTTADRMRSGLAGMASSGMGLLGGRSLATPVAPLAPVTSPDLVVQPGKFTQAVKPIPRGDMARNPRWWERDLQRYTRI